MPTFEELDALSSEDLHKRAVHHAERHANVKFLWELIKATPAATTAAAGDGDEAAFEIQNLSLQLGEALEDDKDGVRDGLRPLYIQYIQDHPDA